MKKVALFLLTFGLVSGINAEEAAVEEESKAVVVETENVKADEDEKKN